MSDSPIFEAPPHRLESGLEEKNAPLNPGDALVEAQRCLYCHDAPCIPSCPTAIDIPTFIRKIATGNLKGSARTILNANLLAASCARVCPVEVLCEETCVYVGWNRPPITIGKLQRYAMDHAASPDLLPRNPPTGFSVGLVGAGPASLACAGTLSLLGHETVLYERDPLPGGLNTTGVAPYKMNLNESLAEVSFILKLGVDLQTGVEVGRTITGKELLDRHQFIFIGPGLGSDSKLNIPGEDGEGVQGAVAWIRRLKTEPGYTLPPVKNAVVIGGGNTALDAARELGKLGVPHVYLVYRRSEEDMSGYLHEWSAAKEEGVTLISNAAPREVLREKGHVLGLSLARTKDGKPTQDALADLPCDFVVVAIGQSKLRGLAKEFPGVELTEDGCIKADPQTFVTGNPQVFAGGDARNGGKEVVNAVDEGQRAARAIDAQLRSSSTPKTGSTSTDRENG